MKQTSILPFLLPGGLAAVAIAVSAVAPAIAQTPTQTPVFDTTQTGDGTRDPFGATGDAQMGGFFDMFHRLNMGTVRSLPEFQQDQQETIGTEAQNFRSRQLELLRQQNQVQPAAPTSAPANSQP